MATKSMTVITKLTGKHSILRLVGLLSDDEAAELKKNVKETRKVMRRRMARTNSSYQS